MRPFVGATLGRILTLSPFGSFDGYDVANGLAEETPDLTTPSMGASVQQKAPRFARLLWAQPFTGCSAKGLEPLTLSPPQWGLRWNKKAPRIARLLWAQRDSNP